MDEPTTSKAVKRRKIKAIAIPITADSSEPKKSTSEPFNRPLSINSDSLTPEQQEMYHSILHTWAPELNEKNSEQFICHLCSKEFKDYHNLYLHTKRTHSSAEAAVDCEICYKTFKNKHYLYMHRMNKHYNEQDRSVCQFCLQEFRTPKALLLHMKRIHPKMVPKFKCQECDKEFDVPRNLRYHINDVHKKDKNHLRCPVCDKVSQTTLSLRKHMSKQHSNVSYPCVFCPQTFKTRYHMKRHVLNIHPPLESMVSCPQCSKEFKNIHYLREHLKTHESKKRELKKLTCDVCGKILTSEYNLKKHKKIVHAEDKVYKFECDKCRRKFLKNNYLNEHIRNVHFDVEEKFDFTCDLCSKKFRVKKYLRRHIVRHYGHSKILTKCSDKEKVLGVKEESGGDTKELLRCDIEFIECEPETFSSTGTDSNQSDSE